MTSPITPGPAAHQTGCHEDHQPAHQTGRRAGPQDECPASPGAGRSRPGATWTSAAIAVYPPAWRRRYQDELEALVGDLRDHGQRTAPLAADLLRGALVAWLTYRRDEMPEQRRSALIAVLWSWVPFAAIAAWYGRDLNITPNRPLAAAAHRLHPGLVTSYYVLLVAGVIAVAVTAVAAVVFAVAVARNTPAERRQRTYALMAVPPVIAVIWMAGVWWLSRAHLARPTGFPVIVTWLFLGIAGIAAATVVVTRLIRSTELPARTWQVGVAAAVTVTAAMVVGTGAILAWGLLMRSSQTVTGSAGDVGGWLLVSAVMAVTAGRAVVALTSLRHHGRTASVAG